MKRHPKIKLAEVAGQATVRKAKTLDAEKDSWRAYAYRRLAEEGEDAEKLFKF